MADNNAPVIANPNAPEIFADKTTSVSLRGNIARITLASERTTIDPRAPETVISGHLAITVRGFLQLYGQMQSVVRQMEASGLLKPAAKPASKPIQAKRNAPARAKSAASSSKVKSKKT